VRARRRRDARQRPGPGLLTAERTALNYASHLSGVATATAAWVDGPGRHPRPGPGHPQDAPTYRALQKYAVRCGGGVNHRFSLSDMAMVKDNHVVAAGGVVPAYRAVRAAYPELAVEVEVTDLDQLRDLLDAGLRPHPARQHGQPHDGEAVRITAGRATLEASGGLTFERARASRRDRGGLHLGRGAHPLGEGVRPRHGPPGGAEHAAARGRHRQQPHRPRLLTDGEVVADWRVATDERRTSDEWAVLLRGCSGPAWRA
jgi:hypothetical protein